MSNLAIISIIICFLLIALFITALFCGAARLGEEADRKIEKMFNQWTNDK